MFGSSDEKNYDDFDDDQRQQHSEELALSRIDPAKHDPPGSLHVVHRVTSS